MTMEAEQLRDKVGSILDKYQHNKSMLVSILQDTQAVLGYLPREALVEVSAGLEIPLSRVYSVATFFRAFNLKPRGRHTVEVCLGTACHVRGAAGILGEIEREEGIKPGDTSEDLRFSLKTTNCVGACALGPVAIVDGKYEGKIEIDKVRQLLAKYK